MTDVVIDEAGTVSLLDTTCFVMAWNALRSLTLVGDVNQLPNFTAPLTRDQRKWGFESALRLAYDHPLVPKTPLTEVFRSHPAIVRVLAKFAYEQLRTTVTEEKRKLMQHVGISAAERFPIVFVDCTGGHEETLAKSYTNKEQNRIAVAIGKKLRERLGSCDIRFLTMYSGARDDINEDFVMAELDCTATAVDAAQGQECDLTVLNTTLVPTSESKTGKGSSGFFGMRERITVAISRARHGVIIIGNEAALRKEDEWAKLLTILREECSEAFVAAEAFLSELEASSNDNMALALASLGFPKPWTNESRDMVRRAYRHARN